jgi:ribosomal protein S18 acetylase RimI-like enzyme
MRPRSADGETRASALAPLHGPAITDPVTIRVATLADLEIVAELRLALVREHGENLLYSRMRPDAPILARRHFAAQLRSPDEVMFLAECGGRTIGILRCVQVAGIPLVFPALHAYISSVYVVPEARRCGVLRKLFMEAVHWCRARGLDEIRLHNAIDNQAANEAWGSLGFEPSEYLRVLHLE